MNDISWQNLAMAFHQVFQDLETEADHLGKVSTEDKQKFCTDFFDRKLKPACEGAGETFFKMLEQGRVPPEIIGGDENFAISPIVHGAYHDHISGEGVDHSLDV